MISWRGKRRLTVRTSWSSAPARAVTRPRWRRSAARIFPSPVSRTRDVMRRQDAWGRCEPCSSRPTFRRLATLPSRKRTGCSCRAAVRWCCSTSPSPVQLGLDPARRGEIETQLLALVPHDVDVYGIRTRTAVVADRSAGEAIIKAVRRIGPDVVVMSSHGRSGLRRAARGVGRRTRDARGAEAGVDRAGLRRRAHRIPRGPGVTLGRGTSP